MKTLDKIKINKNLLEITTKTTIDISKTRGYFSHISSRGHNSTTKYLLIPKQLRNYFIDGQEFECRLLKKGFIFIKK